MQRLHNKDSRNNSEKAHNKLHTDLFFETTFINLPVPSQTTLLCTFSRPTLGQD